MLPVHSQGRAGHRRSTYHQSSSTGAFTALGALPRRTSRKPTFHIEDDDDGSSSHDSVPFPRTSPLHSPSLPRSPIISKPLKSSLKSSSSSPNIPFPAQSLVPSIMFPDLHPKQHQRASSAPCSPLVASSSPPSTSSSSASSSSLHNHVHKNVHFPSQEEGGLATIRLFSRTARPASLSRLGEETETDTDGEASSTGYGNGSWPGWSGKYVGGSTFPFPRVPANAEKKSPLNPSKQKKIQYSIDWSASSVIPRKNVNRGNENIFFESLHVVDGDDDGMGFEFFLFYLFPANFVPETALEGTFLVRNITYQKTVMVRYTIDEWETVNDVSGWYDGNGEGWDRFKFSISLGGQGLQERVVWLVGKYAGGTGEFDAVEWWDNNEGKNYRVGFKEVVDQDEPVEVYKRSVAVSAPSKFCLSFVKRYALIDNIATYTSPASTITRPKLSAPQISSPTFLGQQSRYQQEREKERERERAQHQAAITQGMLSRLKKLNLKNYAAPRGYGYGQSFSTTKETTPLSSPKLTPPVLTLTSASPTTSPYVRSFGSSPTTRSESPSAPNLSLNTSLEMSSPTLSTASTASTTTSRDSTPVQTPTQGDEEDGEEGWKVGGEEEDSLRWNFGMENGHFATTLLPSPTTSPIATPLGSPIPVSIPGDRNTFSYTTYPKSGGVEMGASPPFSDLKESVVGRGVGGGRSVYWDWGTAADVALGGGEVKKETAYESTNGSGGGLMPPQRRRGLQQKRTSGTSSSSGSDSNSRSSKLSTSTFIPNPPSSTAPSSVTPKQKLKPPKLDLPSPTFKPPTSAASVTSPSGVQSPYPRRGLGYNNPPPPPQSQRQGHRYYQSMPSFMSNSKSSSTPEDSDAIYQALVREWCFAQGPSDSNSGETTPVVVKSPSPLGLVCAMGDGE